MFYIIYNTLSKYIIASCLDNSTPISGTLESRFSSHLKLNRLNVNEYKAVELPHDEDLEIVIGRDMFNEDTSTIYADPNWVAPTPEPTEPTV